MQAMAGLARAGEGEQWLREALQLFTERNRLNFAVAFICSDDATLVELARAALHVGSPDAPELLKRACDAGSLEARRLAAGPIQHP